MFNLFKKNDIGEPPWNYYFLVNLDEKEYSKYLAKIFKYMTGENLPLKYDFKNQAWIIDKKRCKTFNQKLQWIKLYGITDLMRKCTDKAAVRDYVAEKIGSEYLKPVFQIIPNDKSSPHPNPLPLGEGTNSKIQGFNQKMKADKLGGHPLPAGEGWGEGTAPVSKDVSTYFDQINWDKLPNAFVIKCNHGSKWHYIIKDKEQYLNTPQLVEITKRQITGWLEQEYFPWNGFEMQYKGIEPKIIVELLLREEINQPVREIEVYCFNGKPKIFVNVRYENQREISYFDENFEQIDLILHPDGNNIVINEQADDYINQTFDLSIILSKDFNFIRVDWLVYQDKLYFNEMTFTPYSGLISFDMKWNLKIGNWINLERNL